MSDEGRLISSSLPWFEESEIQRILEEVREALSTGVLTRGPRVDEFEQQFAAMIGARHAVAVANGTAALEIALRFHVLEGAEVIVPTNTFLSSANSVIFAGGRPVFADINAASLCISLASIQKNRSERTRGVMVVHIAGMVCPEMDDIRRYCKTEGLFLIEDAAHAHGASRNGTKAGILADVGAFSFFPTKPMTTGEGGMITSDNETLALFAAKYRNHGVPPGKTIHESVGTNLRLDELSAILGLSQLRSLPRALGRRQAIAAAYTEGLRGLNGIKTLPAPSGSKHSYYKFPVVFSTRESRDQMAEVLRRKYGVQTGTVYWLPCHLQPVVRARPDLYMVRSPLPVAEDVLPRVLTLPVHAGLDDATVAAIIAAIHSERHVGAGS